MKPKIPLLSKYGRLTPLGETFRKSNGRYFVLVVCDCGTTKTVNAKDLRGGRINSCGCLRREMVATKNTVHALTKHPLYTTWSNMKSRCYNPKESGYHNYGGRGITICKEWKNDFKAFYSWSMANGWTLGLTIDRFPNNDGNYEPINCRWVTKVVNSQKTRRTKLTMEDAVFIRSITNHSIAELTNIYGVHKSTIGHLLAERTWKQKL